MGNFVVPVEIGDPGANRFESIVALVDTGATYTWVPTDILERLEVHPTEERVFILADGREALYGLAFLTVRLDGKTQPTLVVFGDRGTDPLLGVFTLEGFGLGVDPVNQRLIAVPALLKRFT